MENSQKKEKLTKSERFALLVFAVFSGLYLLNVLIAKGCIVYGWTVFHFGNVGEFLILFAASTAFVVAALHREAVFKSNEKTDQT